jgi:hypothetical protein
MRSIRKEGDPITIRARIYNENNMAVPGAETEALLRIRSQGLVSDVGAAVLFLRGINPSPGPFKPAAGAYAVIRFKGWRDNEEASSPFFGTLAPGMGIAVVAVTQSDGSTKLAWTASFQFFNDVLQVNVGVTSDGDPIWGFGLGLHKLVGLGTYF